MKPTNRHKTYIWQHEEWAKFRWDSETLLEPLSHLSQSHGLLLGRMSMLGFMRKAVLHWQSCQKSWSVPQR